MYYSGRLRTARLQVRFLPGVPFAALAQLQEALRSGRSGWGATIREANILIWGTQFVAGLGSQVPHTAPIGLSRDRTLRVSARR